MWFDEKFYEDEVRDNFYVPSIMKRVWASQMEILSEVDRVCKLHEIPYFLACGTLLGAVRHKGYIPWDDDIDICMKRKDYMRFLKEAIQDFPLDYDVVSIYSDEHEYYDISIWVTNSRQSGVNFDEGFLKKNHGVPFWGGIDIFPLDYLPPKGEEEEFVALDELIKAAIYSVDEGIYEGEVFDLVEAVCGTRINRCINAKKQLMQLYDKLISIYSEDESTHMTIISLWKKQRSLRYNKNWFNEVVDLEFEGYMFPAPKNYIDVLNLHFGNWRAIYRSGGLHEYPIMAGWLGVLLLEHGLRYGTYSLEIEQVYKSLDRLNRRNKSLPIRDDKSVRNDTPMGKKRILFLPFCAHAWHSMDKLYRKMCDNDNNDVRVVALPYYRKDLTNHIWHSKDHKKVIEDAISKNIIEPIYNLNNYPIEVIRWNEFDIKEFQPDVIVIQNPYDQYNGEITISPEYYSEQLLDMTDCLIYIPYFEITDIEENDERSIANMDYYVGLSF